MDSKGVRRIQSEFPSRPLCVAFVTFAVKFNSLFQRGKVRNLNDFAIKVKRFGISNFHLVEISNYQVFTADQYLSVNFG